MLTTKMLQEQQAPWVKHNFGDRLPRWPLMGLIEEVGELAHAQLKKEQAIRGTPEEHDEAMRDAIADITIFFGDYCTAMGWKMDEILRVESFRTLQFNCTQWVDEPWRLVLRMGKFIGKIAAAFDEKDEAAGQHASYILFGYLAKFCVVHNWDMQAIVEETWASVSKRDFKKYQRTGLPPKPFEGAAHVFKESGLYEVVVDPEQRSVTATPADKTAAAFYFAAVRGRDQPKGDVVLRQAVPGKQVEPIHVQEPKRPDDVVPVVPTHPDRIKAYVHEEYPFDQKALFDKEEYKERFDRYPFQDEQRRPDPIDGKSDVDPTNTFRTPGGKPPKGWPDAR